jgi:hypothetical protein
MYNLVCINKAPAGDAAADPTAVDRHSEWSRLGHPDCSRQIVVYQKPMLLGLN